MAKQHRRGIGNMLYPSWAAVGQRTLPIDQPVFGWTQASLMSIALLVNAPRVAVWRELPERPLRRRTIRIRRAVLDWRS